MLQTLEVSANQMREKSQYIQMVLNNAIRYKGIPRQQLQQTLEEEHHFQHADLALALSLDSLTTEKAAQLQQRARQLLEELERIRSTSPLQMWEQDLQDLQEALEDRATWDPQEEKAPPKRSLGTSSAKPATKKRAK